MLGGSASSRTPGPDALDTLRDWTREVALQTERWLGEFEQRPGQFGYSSNRYRMVVMRTVLSCRFKLACVPDGFGPTSDNRDCRFQFIDGPLTGFGGTCASLAVLLRGHRPAGLAIHSGWYVDARPLFCPLGRRRRTVQYRVYVSRLRFPQRRILPHMEPIQHRSDEDLAEAHLMANLWCREELAFSSNGGQHACSTICSSRRLRRHYFTPGG